jgi:hypothetical protein
MKVLPVIALGLLLPYLEAQSFGTVTGIVLDAQAGQALSNIDVQLLGSAYRSRSGAEGRFQITTIAPGDYILQASTVGYRTVKTEVHIDHGKTQEFQLILTADTLRRTDTVAVQADSLLVAGNDPGDRFLIRGNDLKNLATVLADDPMRAVQAVPGVTSNDDFESRFSLRGAGFDRIGVYLDGILLHQPVHTLEQTDTSGSASVFNADLVDQLELYTGALPQRFADSSAGALDVHMRDGNPSNYSFRVEASLANVGFMAEGPLGFGHCSWIAGFRKSYLQYLLRRTLADPSMAFGVEDGQGRLSCNVTPKNTIVVEAIESFTNSDRSSAKDQLAINSMMLATQHFQFANLAWHYAPNDKLLMSNRFAWMGDSFDNHNPYGASLGKGQYREFVGSSDANWMWNGHDPLSAGLSVRNIRDDGYGQEFLVGPDITILNRYRGSGTLAGGFLDQSWSVWGARVHFSGGGRWDRHSIDGVSAFQPRVSLSFRPWSTTRIQLGWAQHAQYPEVAQSMSNLGSRGLLPMRSTQVTAAIEQRINKRMRARVEVYNRQDRDLIYQPWLDPRLINGLLFLPPSDPHYANSLRGRGRGIEVLLQRTSANGLTGWISYSYGRTSMHDGVTNDTFPSDWDQRHTVTAYASYRLRPTINVSARWTYGSGFPMPGYLQSDGPFNGLYYYLSGERNRLRLGPYQRLDLRVNKSWMREHWKTTLFVEGVNLTNKVNQRFASFDGVGSGNTAWVTLNQTFPIFPSVGIVFER